MEKTTDQIFVAVIGDIRGSRKTADRRGTQARLEGAMARVNEVFADDLTAGFLVTLGDEFQGLLPGSDKLMDVIAELESALTGIPVRYGIGIGTLATPIKRTAVGMDGPCFYLARDAVERGKRENRWVTVAGFGEVRDELMNGVLNLMGAVRGQWTEIQAETFHAARIADEQKQVAAARNVSEATVSKSLKSAHHDPMIEAEAVVARLLSGEVVE